VVVTVAHRVLEDGVVATAGAFQAHPTLSAIAAGVCFVLAVLVGALLHLSAFARNHWQLPLEVEDEHGVRQVIRLGTHVDLPPRFAWGCRVVVGALSLLCALMVGGVLMRAGGAAPVELFVKLAALVLASRWLCSFMLVEVPGRLGLLPNG
jgi:hypothetical protein